MCVCVCVCVCRCMRVCVCVCHCVCVCVCVLCVCVCTYVHTYILCLVCTYMRAYSSSRHFALPIMKFVIKRTMFMQMVYPSPVRCNLFGKCVCTYLV